MSVRQRMSRRAWRETIGDGGPAYGSDAPPRRGAAAARTSADAPSPARGLTPTPPDGGASPAGVPWTPEGGTPPPPVVIYGRVLPALPESIGRFRRDLDHALACLEVAASRRESIALALSEAATNVVAHAYVGRAPGALDVTAAMTARAVLVTVSDWGGGMRPRTDSPGLGMGLPLLSALTDGIEIRPADAGVGTTITLTFRDAIASLGAPEVSVPIRETLVAKDDATALRDYLDALADHADVRDDARDMIEEAREAVVRARMLREQRDVAG